MRARTGALPELELIALDEEDASPGAQTIDLKSKRWWPVALVGMLVAGAIVATGEGAGSDTAAQITVPPVPSTLFAPAPVDVPTARRVADAQRSAHPAVLISSDATALLVLSRGGAFEVDVAEPPDTIAGYVARPPATVVTLTNGLVRAYSRMYPEGVDLGSARAVFPSQDPNRVWLTGVIDGESAVKEMPVDGTVPPQLATGFIALPDNSSVVGVAGGDLVLSVRTDLSEPYELVTWDPGTHATEFVARSATLVAAAESLLAWIPNECDGCGIFVRRDGVIRVLNGIPNVDSHVAGAFSPDGRFLALAVTGNWPGGGSGAIVHGVTVVDLDPPRRIPGRPPPVGPPVVATPDIRSTAPVAMTWSSGGALLVRDTSDRVVAYEPRAGGTARMFAFRPHEAPRAPTPLAARPTRIPHTMPPLDSPATTLGPVLGP
ncbi:MAG: hypothetical protein EHM63_05940 [Actinobacteria bacterium]|nr:MAG: hypothetical protein EHM63_05940 [Actinomycetota bacterium]